MAKNTPRKLPRKECKTMLSYSKKQALLDVFHKLDLLRVKYEEVDRRVAEEIEWDKISCDDLEWLLENVPLSGTRFRIVRELRRRRNA